MKALRHGVHKRHRGAGRLLRAALLFLSLQTLVAVSTQQSQGDDELVVPIDEFLLRLGPAQSNFSLNDKVTVLWTVENLVRGYFEGLYANSSESIFLGAGITGLSVVPPSAAESSSSQNYETLKFLGGAITFNQSSTATPSESQVQDLIQKALAPGKVIAKLNKLFPELQSVVFIPLQHGNRGFGYPGQDLSFNNQDANNKPTYTPSPSKAPTGSAEGNVGNSQANGLHTSTQSEGSGVGYDRQTTLGLATGVAVGGAVIALLAALLVQSRRRRMQFWRESGRDSGSISIEDGVEPEKISPKGKGAYLEEEPEPALRLPRIWGVVPSPRMEGTGTPPGSSNASQIEGDSIREIITCTSMDRGSIQNVESFEHQKRLVDTLKKEMMASNAEIYPYMQTTHMDNTEPCALSPTDLSAAALENTSPSRPVPTWHAPSDSSFTGSGSESGYGSPSPSPLKKMMETLQWPRKQPTPSSRRVRSPYEPDNAEL